MKTENHIVHPVNKKCHFSKSILVILFICFICCFNPGIAQNINKTILNNTDDIESWIFNNYHPDSIKLTQICQSSCVFMRFKILKGGNIGNIAFNANIPEFIMEALLKAIKSMRNNAIVSEGLQSDEKVYLLPLVYNYEAACQVSFEPKKFAIIEKDIKGKIVDSELLGEAIFNMLNFTDKKDKKMMALDCIILPPISTGNVIMN